MEENKIMSAPSVDRNSNALATLLAEVEKSLALHDCVTGGVDYGYISTGLQAAFDAVKSAAPQQVDAVQAVPGKQAHAEWLLRQISQLTPNEGNGTAIFIAREGLAALASPSPAVPPEPGKTKVVPLEPTEAMLRAAISYREVDADDEILDPQLNMLDRQYRAMIAAAPQQTDTTAPAKQHTNLTLGNAPLGTKAQSITGGHWIKVQQGWKWQNGSTFPRPGGDWNGVLIAPTTDTTAGE